METTNSGELLMALNYRRQEYRGRTYVAYLDEGIGVAISDNMVTFYPWPEPWVQGFTVYSRHVLDMVKKNERIDTFFIPEGTDILTIKCLIEDGLNKIKDKLHADD